MGRKTSITSTGFGESKQTSTAPAEEIAAQQQTSLTGIPPRAVWTVGGVPVGELPEGHAITYSMTDQAVAERARRREQKVEEGWPAEVVNSPRIKERTDMPEPLKAIHNKAVDPDDKAFVEMADKLIDDNFDASVFEADPLAIKSSRYAQQGMAPYWGHERDAHMDKMRGFTPVLGPDGEPVKHGDLTLLQRPERIRNLELAYRQRQTQEAIQTITANDEAETMQHLRSDLKLTDAPPSLNGILGMRQDAPTFGE